ncbi:MULTISPECIES: DUF721 domain-containing protein [Bartonella]|uniref:DUF721 domain-containing protein n=1 Tax=Bartonella rochalimae ATCC BAA-1498 TaxID=685782 RepID=E6YKR1_9HYPH|nr:MULTISPECIES: DciA family protein [Bartonella]AQX18705.1 hypothetical protein BA1379B_008830 [Bartonella sp. A1379B]AQX23217.1 hypothetical protein Bho11B_012200 [Bartonella sp. 11B]AQX23481.1 hypothetical protein Bho114_001370 [Bartonella sp. 114]AQX25675.1 hypothetical protein Bco22_010030 [Bartonella sp. Coyote22sub2]KEC54166.1 hypothetical protein O99_01047 [Bartonella rochalimae ATCC BAA-1498]
MRKKTQKYHFYSLSEMVSEMLDPILRKRTGLNIALIEHWSQIVGQDVGEHTMPIKIIWKYRADQNDTFHPGTLVVACEGFTTLKLMHETDELIQRINSFFGYIAIDRIKIEQKQISVFTDRAEVELFPDEKNQRRLKKMLEEIEDKSLHQSLYKLGCCIFMEKK